MPVDQSSAESLRPTSPGLFPLALVALQASYSCATPPHLLFVVALFADHATLLHRSTHLSHSHLLRVFHLPGSAVSTGWCLPESLAGQPRPVPVPYSQFQLRLPILLPPSFARSFPQFLLLDVPFLRFLPLFPRQPLLSLVFHRSLEQQLF